jgi:hypothetical protein
MTNPDVLAKQLLQRAHNRDGLPEILIGLLFLAVSGFQYAWIVLPHRSLVFKASVIVFALGFPAVCLLGHGWVQRFRQRYLVEREGYVESLPSRNPYLKYWLMALVGLCAVLAQVLMRPMPEYWVTGFTGVAGGALAAFAGRAPRFYFAGLVMFATGLGVAFAKLPMENGFLILFGVMGVLELIMGGAAWFKFLSETREATSHER